MDAKRSRPLRFLKVTDHGLGRRLLCAMLMAVACGGAAAQVASEHSVKAGFVYNFMRFTKWPEGQGATDAPLRLCSTGTRALKGQLELLRDRLVGGRAIEVVPGGVNFRQCDLLFLSADDVDREQALLRGLDNAPVLTVGDSPGFVQAGGMIGLRIEDNRMRFDVNLAAVQRSGLKLNSQMLKLAGLVLQR